MPLSRQCQDYSSLLVVVSLFSFLRRRAAAAERAAKPVPKRTTVIGSGIETGDGGTGVLVGRGVSWSAQLYSSVPAWPCRHGGTGVFVVGQRSAYCITRLCRLWCLVSAAGAWACAKPGLTTVKARVSSKTPDKIKKKNLDFLMGNSPVQAIKPMIIEDG